MGAFRLVRSLLAILAAISLLQPVATVQAATHNVSCSAAALIAAIEAANASPEDDVINLQAGCVYLLTEAHNTVSGANGLPVIAAETTAGKLTINGSGATITRTGTRVWLPLIARPTTAGGLATSSSPALQPAVASSAGSLPNFRIILVGSGGNLTLKNVVIMGGHLPDHNGGGILNGGTLIITNSKVANNTAAVGGGIYNTGSLTVIDNTFSGNTASGPGGGINSAGALTVTGTLFIKNMAILGNGIFVAEGESTVINIPFNSEDAITCPDSTLPIPSGEVAKLIEAIHCANGRPGNDVIDLTNSTYTLTTVDNTGLGTGSTGLPVIMHATTSGTLTINGNGAIIERSSAAGTPDFRIWLVANAGNLTLNQITVQNGYIDYDNGGAVFVLDGGSLNLYSSLVTGNTGSYGGGIAAGNGTMTILDSTISNNTSIGDGAAINSAGTLVVHNSLITGNTTNSLGGGILVPEGSLTVTNTTFSNNAASAPASGGALLILSLSEAPTVATVSGCTFSDNNGLGAGGSLFTSHNTITTITNSTFSGNYGGWGGAIANNGDLTLANSTISANQADPQGGGISAGQGTITLRNTIVAGNTADDQGPDIDGAVVSAGYNLIGNTSSATITGDTTGNRLDASAEPLNIGSLQDNGGPTQTMALLAGSAAINAGDPAFTAPPATDQRGAGYPRVLDGRIDIGAFESDISLLCPASPYNIPAGDAAAFIAAIHCANTTPDDDTIILAASTYTLTTIANAGLGSGSTGLPVITDAAASGTLTINGNGAIIERSSAAGTPEFRILTLAYGSHLTLNEVTVSNGYLPIDQNGGGIFIILGTLDLANSQVIGNTANYGGGIGNYDGTLTVSSSTFSNNRSHADGAGINSGGLLTVSNSTFTGNRADGLGGGIVSGGTTTVTSSTFSGNSAYAFAGGAGILVPQGNLVVSGCTFANNYAQGAGGGMFVSGVGTVAVVNSTFNNNDGFSGGGIWNAGALTVTHSTITGNTATNDQGGGIFFADGTIILGSTIVSGNSAANAGPDIYGPVTSLGYNLIGDSSGATITGDTTGNLLDASAAPVNLGPLQDNGGPTYTMALLAGSAAINAGDPAFTAPPDTDQRGAGYPRVLDGHIDIGAFEYEP